MKIVKYIINLIIIPLGTLIFITVGFIAAGISALIEYSVIQQFFTSFYQKLLPSATIALLLVLACEITKIFLHFLTRKQKQKCNVALPPKTITVLTGALVTFSFVCSMIFTTTTLYLPTYDAEVIAKAEEQIRTQLQLDILAVENKYNNQYKENVQPYEKAMNDALEQIMNPVPDGYGPQKTTVYLEGLHVTLEQTTEEYNAATEKYGKIRDDIITQETLKLKVDAENAILQLKDTASIQYDNPVLSHFLTALSAILSDSGSYSRQTYLLLCLLLGLIISALLEAIISVSLQFLATPMDSLTERIDNINDTLRHWCNNLVITLFKAFCAIIIYIFILSAYSVTMEKEKICLGLLACALSIFLIHKYVPIPETAAENRKSQLFYQIRDCLLQGVVSLMGFVLLGFLFGNSALSLDVNTVAIGVGAAISGGIIQLPKFLLKNDLEKV